MQLKGSYGVICLHLAWEKNTGKSTALYCYMFNIAGCLMASERDFVNSLWYQPVFLAIVSSSEQVRTNVIFTMHC